MNETFATALFLPALLLIATVVFPSPPTLRAARRLGRTVTLLAGLQCLIAGTLAAGLAAGVVPIIHLTLLSFTAAWPFSVTVYYDGVASLMFALVSFVGWIICRYSVRYLDGQATQGRYFRWTAFTIGAVAWMVISGNLMMFFVAWVMTSVGLHQLLLHFSHRPAAQRAAWTKFTISRLGDAALLGSLVLVYVEFQTFDFVAIFAAIDSLAGPVSMETSLAGLFLMLGAVTKSAQVPFHTWLPQTMETPTPVSALMHAGIVNAGGYLVIRTSPLLSLTPWVLTALAIIGAGTACFAAVVMLTQTSVKKSLAYSTIAQMGFMMLQCGLGAFSTALLHILAHSLYKAYSFLSSGSVLAQQAATRGARAGNRPFAWTKLAAVCVIVVAFLGIALALWGVDPAAKPGGLLLGGLLCLALTGWLGEVLKMGSPPLLLRALTIAGLLCFAYVTSFVMVDKLVAGSLPAGDPTRSGGLVSVVVLSGFVGLFLLSLQLIGTVRPPWMNAWYVHASNGFYLENTLRRIFGSLASD